MPLTAPDESTYRLYKEKCNDIEIFSVKLTDSVLRTLDAVSSMAVRSAQSNAIQLSVNGNRGTLSIPWKTAYVDYDLSISPFHQTSDGMADIIQLLNSRALNMGRAVSKLTVQANADSFSAAKLKMSEAIMTNSNRSSVREGNLNPRSVPTPPVSRNFDSGISPASAARSCSPSVNAVNSPAVANAEVGSRPLQSRIIHLLAIQSYQRPELLLRLRRDGLTEDQKDKVDGILIKVGRPDRQGKYRLSTTFINLVESNWPGYSLSDRLVVASLKAKLSTGSPSNVINRSSLEGSTVSCLAPISRQNSPITASVAPVDHFGTKSTRTSTSSGSHGLSKKFATVGLPGSGPSSTCITSQHGSISTPLERSINFQSTRQMFTTAPLSSATSYSTSASKPTAPKRVRVSSDESGVHSCGSASSISGDCPLSVNRYPVATTTVTAPAPSASQFVQTSLSRDLVKPTSLRRKRPIDAHLDNIGAGDDVIIDVGDDDRSRGGVSVSLLPINRHSANAQQYRPQDRGSETSSCDDSCSSPSVEMASLSQLDGRRLAIDPSLDNGQLINSCNDGKTSDLSDEDYLYDSISSKNAENERLYPEIANASQAAAYRKAFELLYPKYLRLYEHYRAAWDKIINLKERILSLAGGPHADQMTCIATELDEFLNVMRQPDRQEEEVRLLVMTFKLQLLKQRLVTFASQEGATAQTSNEQP